MKTKIQKTLEILQRAGTEGVHSFHLNALIGSTRSAARIQDLKDQGYTITSEFEKMGDAMGVRYFLNEALKPSFRWEFDNATNTARRIQI